MKNFFKNPYYLVWTIMLGIIILVGIISPFAQVLYRVEAILIGAECIYSAVLLLLYHKKTRVNLEDFQNTQETEEKRFSFSKSEGKVNSFLFVVALFFIGAILIYFAFRI